MKLDLKIKKKWKNITKKNNENNNLGNYNSNNSYLSDYFCY